MVFLGLLRRSSLSNFPPKDHNYRFSHQWFIINFLIVSSDLCGRIQVAFFRKGRVEITKSLKINKIFATYGQSEFGFRCRGQVASLLGTIGQLQVRSFALTSWWRTDASRVEEKWVSISRHVKTSCTSGPLWSIRSPPFGKIGSILLEHPNTTQRFSSEILVGEITSVFFEETRVWKCRRVQNEYISGNFAPSRIQNDNAFSSF